MFQLFRTYVAIVSFGCFKVDQGCCACCNVSHLPQLPTAAAEAPCMEGSGAAGVEGHGKQESVGEWRKRAPPMRATGTGAGVWTRGSTRTSGLQCCRKPIDVMEAPR
jgi:hypothetical protein